MSFLKTTSKLEVKYAYTPDEIEVIGNYAEGNEFYLKTEADKIIAEKDKELLHQKYKRCLDKADWCEERCCRYSLLEEIQGLSWEKEITFYRRLRDKYMELAERFKERITEKII